MTGLISVFNEVKRTFFPRWDTANKWQVQRKNRLSNGYNVDAMCNRKMKTIEISRRYIAEDDNELSCLFAHEICHAIIEGNHGRKWQKRFLKVADRAASLGQQTLADRISRNIKVVQIAMKPTLPSIHQQIEDALMDQPDASFEEVIEWVANNWCLTKHGLLKKYKNLKEFFNRAKRKALFERNFWKEHQAKYTNNGVS